MNIQMSMIYMIHVYDSTHIYTHIPNIQSH